MRRVSSWVVGVALLAGLPLTSGCPGPNLTERELGRVLDKVPPLQGMEDDYKDKLRYVPPNPESTKRFGPPTPPRLDEKAPK